MGKISLGVNMEFVRHDDKPFEWGVEKAAQLGYEYVEPMVHSGRQLLSEGGYFHSISMSDDPYRIRRACEAAGIKLSGPFRPFRALPAGQRRRAPETGDSFRGRVQRRWSTPTRVPSNLGPRRGRHVLMRYTLHEAAAVAEPRGILIGLEPPSGHQDARRPGPDLALSITGHRHQLRHGQRLPGRPGSGRLAPPRQGSPGSPPRQRHLGRAVGGRAGKVAGTPVGCACGDGVIDWAKVIEVCRPLPAISSSASNGHDRPGREECEYLRSLL